MELGPYCSPPNTEKSLKNQESATETEDREELYAELFGVSQFSDDGRDESDVHKRCVFPDFSSSSTEK